MTQMIDKHGLRVAAELADFLDTRDEFGLGHFLDARGQGVDLINGVPQVDVGLLPDHGQF